MKCDECKKEKCEDCGKEISQVFVTPSLPLQIFCGGVCIHANRYILFGHSYCQNCGIMCY